MDYMPLHPSDKAALSQLSDKMVGHIPDFNGFEPVGKVYARYYLFIWAVNPLNVDGSKGDSTKYLATQAVPISRRRFELVPYTLDPDSKKILYSREEFDELVEEFDGIKLQSLERKRG